MMAEKDDDDIIKAQDKDDDSVSSASKVDEIETTQASRSGEAANVTQVNVPNLAVDTSEHASLQLRVDAETVTQIPPQSAEHVPEHSGEAEFVTQVPPQSIEHASENSGEAETVTRVPPQSTEHVAENLGEAENVKQVPPQSTEHVAENLGEAENVTQVSHQSAASLDQMKTDCNTGVDSTTECTVNSKDTEHSTSEYANVTPESQPDSSQTNTAGTTEDIVHQEVLSSHMMDSFPADHSESGQSSNNTSDAVESSLLVERVPVPDMECSTEDSNVQVALISSDKSPSLNTCNGTSNVSPVELHAADNSLLGTQKNASSSVDPEITAQETAILPKSQIQEDTISSEYKELEEPESTQDKVSLSIVNTVSSEEMFTVSTNDFQSDDALKQKHENSVTDCVSQTVSSSVSGRSDLCPSQSIVEPMEIDSESCKNMAEEHYVDSGNLSSVEPMEDESQEKAEEIDSSLNSSGDLGFIKITCVQSLSSDLELKLHDDSLKLGTETDATEPELTSTVSQSTRNIEDNLSSEISNQTEVRIEKNVDLPEVRAKATSGNTQTSAVNLGESDAVETKDPQLEQAEVSSSGVDQQGDINMQDDETSKTDTNDFQSKTLSDNSDKSHDDYVITENSVDQEIDKCPLDTIDKPSVSSDSTGKVSKSFTFNLQKARSMLHHALGTTMTSNQGPIVKNTVANAEQSKGSENQTSSNLHSIEGEQDKSIGQKPVSKEVVVKTGKSDTFLNSGENVTSGEPGDILDILKTDSVPKKSTTAIEKPKPKSNQIAKKSTTKKSEGLNKKQNIVVPPVHVKTEPLDDYDVNVYGSMYNNNIETTVDPQTIPSKPTVVIENVQGNVIEPNSLSQLSSQVDRLPVTGTGIRSLASKSSPVPSTTVRWPVTLARLPTTTSSGLPGGSFTFTAPNIVGMTNTVTSTADAAFVPIVMPVGSNAKTMTIRLNNISQAPVKTSKVTTTSNNQKRKAMQPPKISAAVPKPTNTPQPSQPKKQKTISPAALPVSSINIDTVGLPKITELIARKNPIPNYKAPPIPGELSFIVSTRLQVCYECGDTFALENSLKQHRARYSMKISYKCDECQQEKYFFNKCQFLGHLRQHLNIEKTQAVPIHIKSDSISIQPLPRTYEHLIFQTPPEKPCTTDQRTLDITGDSTMGSKRCRECGTKLPVMSMSTHFGHSLKNCDLRHFCSICMMFLPSICSMRAHRRLHQPGSSYVCPECGEHFEKLIPSLEHKTPENALGLHLLTECYHFNRVAVSKCTKCDTLMECNKEIKYHLLEKLDQYLKCLQCPMAFKTKEAMTNHFESHEKDVADNKPMFKIIYRCHLCDSVMDDLTVLEVHTDRHVSNLKEKSEFRFKCSRDYTNCKEIFEKVSDLKSHVKEKHGDITFDTENLSCPTCSITFNYGSLLTVALHSVTHRSPLVMEHKPCKQCRHIFSAQEFIDHKCNEKKAQKIFDCNICKMEIKTKAKLLKHMEKHRKNGNRICLICYKVGFKDDLQLALHESSCQMEKAPLPHQCDDCKYKFATQEELETHRKKEHPFHFSHLFPCHLCEHAYESEAELKRHVKVKHEAKRTFFTCDICKSRGMKRVFANKAVLEKHLISRHRVGKNNVVIDDNLDNSANEDEDAKETQEEQNHDEDSMNSPEDRGTKRKFFDKSEDRPIKKLHVEGEALFRCAKCAYSCDDRKTFQDHLVIHKVDNNFLQCTECGLSFAVIPSLRKHLFMVHKIKDFDAYCRENSIVEIIVDDDQEIRDVPPIPDSRKAERVKEDTSESDGDFEKNPLECQVCHKMLESEGAIRSHMRTHGMAFIRNKRRRKLTPQCNGGGETSDSSLSSSTQTTSGKLSD